MSMKALLDELDIAILKELQDECRSPLQVLADNVNAPLSTVHYRLKRLERAGIIEGYSARVNPERLDMEYITVVRLRCDIADVHYDSIGSELAKIPGVWIVYLILGDFDFLLLTRSKDRQQFLGILDQILKVEGFKSSSTSLVIKVIKEDARLNFDFFE